MKVASLVDELLDSLEIAQGGRRGRKRSPAAIRRDYVRFIDDSSAPFLTMVDLFYNHSFRELFLHGQGPFEVQKAIIAILILILVDLKLLGLAT